MSSTRALILSGATGAMGEECFAEACAGTLQSFGMRCQVLDAMRLVGKRRGALFAWAYRRMVTLSPIYDAYYFSQLRVESSLAKRTHDKLIIDAIEGRLRREVERSAPDVILSAFPVGAAAAARLRERDDSFRHVVFFLDSFAYRLFVHEATDLFLVPSALAAESIRRFQPDARVEVVVPPVRPEFWTAPSKEEARASLGVPRGCPCVLVISSALGIGPLDVLARELADDGCFVLVVGGSNDALVARLQALSRSHPNVVPFGYTDRLPELMAASDVVVTSSGANICREARIVGRSLVLLDVLAGHGRENLQHELELGSAAASSLTPSTLRRTVRAFLADPDRCRPPAPPKRDQCEHQLLAALQTIGITGCG